MAHTTAIGIFILVCFTTIIQVRPQDVQPCRLGWKHFRSSCYLFSSQKGTWPEAQAYCMSFEAYLTEINDAAENTFIKNILKKPHGRKRDGPVSYNSYWIGGDDIEVEGHFIWSKNNLKMNFTDWDEGQPDSTRHDEDCVELRHDFDYHWNDMFCTTKQKFICEMPEHIPPAGIIIG